MLRRLLVAVAFVVLPAGSPVGASGEGPAACAERVLLGSATPVAVGGCGGVRPGAMVLSGNSLCSLNFAFQGSDGAKYIGTAGHCVLDDEGSERAWAAGTGPEARDGDGRVFGRFAYAWLDEPHDFALIRVEDERNFSPSMCHFGGPTGVYDDRSSDPVVVHHYGNGAATGNAWVVDAPLVPGRTGVAAHSRNPDEMSFAGLASPGDSGGAVIVADGRAVGPLVALAAGLDGTLLRPSVVGPVLATRLGPQVARATHVTGIGFTLLTAPLR